MKTLVILQGNARGGEETWNSMYKYLLEPLKADLALLFGKTNDHSSSLYRKCKYLWELEEYNNWRQYYEKNFPKSHRWFKVFEHNQSQTLGGGVDNFIGSGAISLAFRHFLKKNFKNILLKYDRIILTRSDYFYIDNHPVLSNDYFYIIEGEDNGGLNDRHHIFSKNIINKVLGVLEFLDSIENNKYLTTLDKFLNIEKFLKLFYERNGLVSCIKRFKSAQFTVQLSTDKTRWQRGKYYMLGSKIILIKYKNEYYSAIKIKYGLFLSFFIKSLYYIKNKYFLRIRNK